MNELSSSDVPRSTRLALGIVLARSLCPLLMILEVLSGCAPRRTVWGELINSTNVSALSNLVHVTLKRGDKEQVASNFCFAVTRTNVEMVTAFLDGGASPDTSRNDFSVLHRACTRGNYPVARLLLERGANANIKGGWDFTPLHSATRHPNIVALLLLHGADQAARNEFGYAPLGWSALCEGDSARTLASCFLLSQDTNYLNLQARNGWSPLMAAAWGGESDVVDLLLRRGANRALIGSEGTALDMAKTRGHLHCIQLLQK